MSETRFLNLTNATTGQIRTATYQGREHLVVPVVALMEGVIFPVNAAHPELVLASEFSAAPQGWNGRPLFLNHPAANGVQISGNSPKVLESAIGQVFNARISGKRLLMEAWIDTAKARSLGATGESLVARAAAGKPVEVSVGVFVVTEAKIGDYNGKQYKAIWHDVVPDHLALLPDGVLGACSYEMGCGIRAAMSNRIVGDAYEMEIITAQETHMELETARDISQKDREGHPHSDFAGPGTSFPIFKPEDVAAAAHSIGRAKGDPEAIKARIIEIAYRKGDAYVAQLPDAWKRDQKNAAAAGDVETPEEDKKKADDEAAEMYGLAGKRHSSTDQQLVQGLHDYSVKLGAMCDQPASTRLADTMHPMKMAEARMAQELEFHALAALVTPTVLAGAPTPDKETHPFTYCKDVVIPDIEEKGKTISDPAAFCGWWKAQQQKNAEGRTAELKAAAGKCKCSDNHGGEADMDKKTRVKTLVGHPYSPFSDADVPMLEGIGDDRLAAFETAAESRAAEAKKAEEELRTAKDAQVKAEGQVTELKAAAAAVLPEDEWLKRAPARVRALVEDAQKAEQTKRDELIGQLKTAQSAYNEDELKALSTEHLEKLGKVAIKTAEAKVVDFSGRGLKTGDDNKVPAAPDMNEKIRTLRAAK